MFQYEGTCIDGASVMNATVMAQDSREIDAKSTLMIALPLIPASMVINVWMESTATCVIVEEQCTLEKAVKA